MRQVVSDALGDFSAIYDEDVEVVCVTRPQASTRKTFADQLISARQVPQLRWVQAANDPDAPSKVLPDHINAEVLAALSNEIAEACELLGVLMDCEQIGVRLETLNAPMCPRFHVDFVHCRMLITLSGVGTDWIPNPNVDWDIFADLDTTAPPTRVDTEIQQLSTGNWSLLKGGKWSDHFDGVVHRSPHTSSERLLLTLDPIM